MLDHLPYPIFLEILYSIPVSFLIKCMYVSKTWYSLIKSAEFIYSHLESSISRNTKDANIVRLLKNEGMGFSVHFESFESHQHFHKQLDIPPVLAPPLEDLNLIGYSNGIFCYALSEETDHGTCNYQYLLWNPSIQKYLSLPKSRLEYHIVAAFVFDSNVNDFKVVAVHNAFGVELYSLRNRSWKIISLSHPYFFDNINYTFVDGVIYFLGCEDYDEKYTDRRYIVGFNLGDEVFHKIMLPESIDVSVDVQPIPYGNKSIAVVAFYPRERIELLLTEEMSVSGTWKKVLLDMSPRVDTFFGVWKGSVLFENRNGRVTSLDLKCQQSKDVGLIQKILIQIFQLGYYNYDAIHRYEETLALLDIGKDISTLEEVYLCGFDNASDETLAILEYARYISIFEKRKYRYFG